MAGTLHACLQTTNSWLARQVCMAPTSLHSLAPHVFALQATSLHLARKGHVAPGCERQLVTCMPVLQATISQLVRQGQKAPSQAGTHFPPLHNLTVGTEKASTVGDEAFPTGRPASVRGAPETGGIHAPTWVPYRYLH